MLVDGEKPLRLCKHCQKVFLSSRSNSAFCNPRCKMCIRDRFLRKRKIFFRGGEAVVEAWEDELLWDDDFSDEAEGTCLLYTSFEFE